MTIEEKIKILKDQLYRFKVTKNACDTCIPQELINSHEEIIKDLERLEKLEEVLIILNLIYEWKLEVKEFEGGPLGYFIKSIYEESYNLLTEDQYNNFKEVLDYIKTLY